MQIEQEVTIAQCSPAVCKHDSITIRNLHKGTVPRTGTASAARDPSTSTTKSRRSSAGSPSRSGSRTRSATSASRSRASTSRRRSRRLSLRDARSRTSEDNSSSIICNSAFTIVVQPDLTLGIQGSTRRPFPGLMNFVIVVAYHFCLNLAAAFSQPGNGPVHFPWPLFWCCAKGCVFFRYQNEESKVGGSQSRTGNVFLLV